MLAGVYSMPHGKEGLILWPWLYLCKENVYTILLQVKEVCEQPKSMCVCVCYGGFCGCRYVFHGTLLDTEEKDWDQSFDINVKSMFFSSKVCVGMVRQHVSKKSVQLYTYTRNAHVQWASRQVYASPTQPPQLCMRMSINNIPDCDRHTYIHHENRSLIPSLTLMRSAII